MEKVKNFVTWTLIGVMAAGIIYGGYRAESIISKQEAKIAALTEKVNYWETAAYCQEELKEEARTERDRYKAANEGAAGVIRTLANRD